MVGDWNGGVLALLCESGNLDLISSNMLRAGAQHGKDLLQGVSESRKECCRHVRTLVLDLDDTLIHSDWTRGRGWRTFKRPGAEDFLRQVCCTSHLFSYEATGSQVYSFEH